MEISWKQSFLIPKPANTYHRHPREKKDSPLWTPSLSFLPRSPLVHTWRVVTAEIVLSPTQTLPQDKGHSVDVTTLKAKGAGSWNKMVCTDNSNQQPSRLLEGARTSVQELGFSVFHCCLWTMAPLASMWYCVEVCSISGVSLGFGMVFQPFFWVMFGISATFWRSEWAHTTSLGCWHFHRIVFFPRTAWN